MQVAEMGRIDQHQNTIDLCRRLFSDSRLIIASNRGPAEYSFVDGDIQVNRGSGGVVTALTSVSSYTGVTWVASPMGDGDRIVARSSNSHRLLFPFAKRDLRVQFVPLASNAYELHYNVFCNPLLWFIQHHLWDIGDSFDLDEKYLHAWHNGYVPVNHAFAESVSVEALRNGPRPVIMLHDYHLYLAASLIRKRVPNAIIQHFVHIPWPDPSYWQILPRVFRTAICEGLAANDIVGMQTNTDVVNFLHTCERSLDDKVVVDYDRKTVKTGGHTCQVRAYPISIDIPGIRSALVSEPVRRHRERLRAVLGEKTIVRVDRMDPSKNIIRGFKAYEALLERYPEFIGMVKFLAFLVPSRTDIPEYNDYARKVKRIIGSINRRFETDSWRPIELFYENNYPQAIAGMSFYDVLMVNSVMDGMNLVAKEGPMVNGRAGVLLLSEGAGAFEQLKGGAVEVAPMDIGGTSEALYRALTMPEDEKRARIDRLRRIIERDDLALWLNRQLRDILPLAEKRMRPVLAAQRGVWAADMPM